MSSSVAMDAGVADLAVDVRPFVGIAAVQRHRIEGRRQALGGHARRTPRWKRRLVRKASPSPANMRVGSSPSRLNGNTPAVNGKRRAGSRASGKPAAGRRRPRSGRHLGRAVPDRRFAGQRGADFSGLPVSPAYLASSAPSAGGFAAACAIGPSSWRAGPGSSSVPWRRISAQNCGF